MSQELLGMGVVDGVIAGIILLSSLISLIRGFLKELVSLGVWVLGSWLAIIFHDQAAVALAPYITDATIRDITSFGVIFLSVLIFGMLFNYILSFIVTKSGLSGTDRLLGMVFGGARGMLLVAVVILVVSSTAFVQDEWWKNSVLIHHFQVLVDWLRDFLPEKVTDIAHAMS